MIYGTDFQDRPVEVEAPERIQADLMRHKTLRPIRAKVQVQNNIKNGCVASN